jgi:uncharacterized protein (TIGR03083 family)
MNTDDIEQNYLAAQRSFVAFARDLSADDWAAPVPCCPGWTVRDVLSHVAGIPDDVFAGRIDGVATDPWTAAQVERNRSLAVDDLLARWDEQSVPFAALMQQIEQDRPPIDCHAHEHDIRHALGRPGDRDSDIIVSAAAEMLDNLREQGVELRGATPFEVFRSRLGRRSRSQLDDYDWVGEPDAVAAVRDAWFAFGPAEQPIIE